MDLLFQKVYLSLQNSGPFICEGGSFEPTEPPCYGPEQQKLCLMFKSVNKSIYMFSPMHLHVFIVYYNIGTKMMMMNIRKRKRFCSISLQIITHKIG